MFQAAAVGLALGSLDRYAPLRVQYHLHSIETTRNILKGQPERLIQSNRLERRSDRADRSLCGAHPGRGSERLLTEGLRRTSLDDIAEAAGVGRATLFRRFPNRAALLLALGMQEAHAAIASVDRTVAGIDDPEELLVAGLIAVIHEITGNELLQRLLVTDPDVVLPVASTQGGAVLALGREYIAGQLRRIHADGADVLVSAEMLARLVLSLALNPVSVLPLDDDLRLEAIVRRTVSPLLLARP